MGTELEWKMTCRQADQDRICRDPEVLALAVEPARRYRMRSTYYDTPDRQLRSRRITLRRRMENDCSVICLKAPLPDAPDPHMHGEWELEGEEISDVLPRLTALGAPADLPDSAKLICVCRAEFHRQARLLRFADGSLAELALDQGFLMGRTAREPLCELELEMKSGAPDAARTFLRDLACRYGLSPLEKSKYARAGELP